MFQMEIINTYISYYMSLIDICILRATIDEYTVEIILNIRRIERCYIGFHLEFSKCTVSLISTPRYCQVTLHE